jgi:hypothetical protein
MADIPGYADANWKAGVQAEGSFSPTQLFTAEDEIKTGAATVLTNQTLDVGTIVAFNAANKLVPWDPTATVAVSGGATSQTAPAAQATPVGVLAAHMDTTSGGPAGAGDRMAPFWEGGCFNPDLLIWPASLDTFAERNAALRAAGAPFRVKRLL